MEENKKNRSDEKNIPLHGTDFAERLWKESWTHIKTVVDTAREPFLVLDEHLRVMAANESFYRMFQVDEKDTEGKIIYELGNGQWDIPALRKLLEDILPKNTFFKGFEVAHEFPSIGRKVMILNARRIYRENTSSNLFPPIILLAMEDVTDMMVVAETLAGHANQLEIKLTERIRNMEKEIAQLKKDLYRGPHLQFTPSL
jgi:PAS domain-containing protein